MKKIILIIILLGVVLFGEDKNIKKALVKIYASHQGHNYKSPWQVGEEYNSTSTGFIVENNQIKQMHILFYMQNFYKLEKKEILKNIKQM